MNYIIQNNTGVHIRHAENGGEVRIQQFMNITAAIGTGIFATLGTIRWNGTRCCASRKSGMS